MEAGGGGIETAKESRGMSEYILILVLLREREKANRIFVSYCSSSSAFRYLRTRGEGEQFFLPSFPPSSSIFIFFLHFSPFI